VSEDINKVILLGRLTRDSELQYTNSGYPLCKMSIASNTRKKQGEQWIDEANFFDITLWGKRGESLNQYLLKGSQIAIDGRLKQERWEKDGLKRSKVTIDAENIQLLGGKKEAVKPEPQQQQQPQQQNQQQMPQQSGGYESYKPPSGPVNNNDGYDDEIPF